MRFRLAPNPTRHKPHHRRPIPCLPRRGTPLKWAMRLHCAAWGAKGYHLSESDWDWLRRYALKRWRPTEERFNLGRRLRAAAALVAGRQADRLASEPTPQ
jgi:hypothetical protein